MRGRAAYGSNPANRHRMVSHRSDIGVMVVTAILGCANHRLCRWSFSSGKRVAGDGEIMATPDSEIQKQEKRKEGETVKGSMEGETVKGLPTNYLATYAHEYPDDYQSYEGTVRWFGDPWPSAESPSPVCHPLAYFGGLPPSAQCGLCGKTLNVERDSGIGIPGPKKGYYWYDIKCWLRLVGD